MNNSKPYQDFKPYQDPHELLSLLAWVDAHDRLDILILEIRHIQTNLVHALRVPVLYRPLRFEERCIWFSDKDMGGVQADWENTPVSYTHLTLPTI
ncbi:MAG TPA: hypothetical protein DIW77_00875, partial [Chromatiaceae bacterium]|nr:hypothetical protein [Chromatiaceae bacterium]